MRTITLLPTEFVHFKELANNIHLWFTYKLFNSMYFIEADDVILESLGY